MMTDLYEYQNDVLDALERMAKIEEDARARAEADGLDDLEAIHEHGAACLREARKAIVGIGRV